MRRKPIGLIILLAKKYEPSRYQVKRSIEWTNETAAALHNKIGIHSKSDAIPHSPLDRFCTVHRLPIRPEAHEHRWIPTRIIGPSAIASSVHVPASVRPTFLLILTFLRCLFFVIRHFHWPMLAGRDTMQQFTNDGDTNRWETTQKDLFLEPTTPMIVDKGSINI